MITQAAVRGFPLETIDVDAAVAAAIEAYDGDTAATIILAAGLRGRRFTAETIRRVVERLDTYEAFVPLIAATGTTRSPRNERADRQGRVKFLVALAESGVLPTATESRALLAALLLIMEGARDARAAHEESTPGESVAAAEPVDNTDICQRITGLVRIRVRTAGPFERCDLALAARILDDRVAQEMANVDPLLLEHGAERIAHQIVSTLRGESLGSIRESAATPAVSGYTVRRDATKVGRNDPCPCGSGKKAKKCCSAGAGPSSHPPAGASTLGMAGPRPAPTHPGALASIPLPELAKLNVRTLPADTASALLFLFNGRHLWRLSERMLNALESAGSEPRDVALAQTMAHARLDLPELRRITAKQALLAGDAMAVLRLTRGTTVTEAFRLEAEFLSPTASVPLERVERVAFKALQRGSQGLDGTPGSPGEVLDLAFTLLRKSPALGILVARGALDPKYPDYTEALVECVERARARLGLDPHDQAFEHLGALLDARDGGLLKAAAAARDTRALGELEAARREAGAARAKANSLKAELRKLERLEAAVSPQANAATAMGPATAADGPTVSADEAKRLRSKVQELKGHIRDAQAERQALRTQLARLNAESSPPSGAPSADEERDETTGEPMAEGEDTAVAPRGLLVPDFAREAQKELRDLPARVARAALQTVTDAAAGDARVWASIKQMYSSGQPLFAARVGIHHRALFRVEDGMLRVLRVITREELKEVLRRVAYS